MQQHVTLSFAALKQRVIDAAVAVRTGLAAEAGEGGAAGGGGGAGGPDGGGGAGSLLRQGNAYMSELLMRGLAALLQVGGEVEANQRSQVGRCVVGALRTQQDWECLCPCVGFQVEHKQDVRKGMVVTAQSQSPPLLWVGTVQGGSRAWAHGPWQRACLSTYVPRWLWHARPDYSGGGGDGVVCRALAGAARLRGCGRRQSRSAVRVARPLGGPGAGGAAAVLRGAAGGGAGAGGNEVRAGVWGGEGEWVLRQETHGQLKALRGGVGGWVGGGVGGKADMVHGW